MPGDAELLVRVDAGHQAPQRNEPRLDMRLQKTLACRLQIYFQVLDTVIIEVYGDFLQFFPGQQGVALGKTQMGKHAVEAIIFRGRQSAKALSSALRRARRRSVDTFQGE